MSGAGAAADRRYRSLIGPAELAGHLCAPDWVVIDCRFALSDPLAGERAYAAGRIPGAVHAHLERDLSAPPGPGSGRHPLPSPTALAATLGRLGIRPDAQVVAYDDSFGSIAARLWWLLRWAGHAQVAVLDGGWAAWKRGRLPVDSGPPTARTEAAPYPVEPDSNAVVDANFIEAMRRAPGWRLLDARSEERFSGEREPMDAVGGHIPGSRNRCFEDNLGFDGNFLPGAELRSAFLAILGEVPPDRVVHTCGSGVTACHNVLAMEHAGLSGSRLYAGSWSEWIGDPSRPVAAGPD